MEFGGFQTERLLSFAVQNGALDFLVDNQKHLLNNAVLANALLLKAASFNRLEIVAFLLSDPIRANVNASERRSKKTPLHLAAKLGSLALAELLIKNGANADKKDQHRGTFVHTACWYGQVEFLKNMLDRYSTLIENKLALLDKNNESILHLAVRNNQLPMVSYILANPLISSKLDFLQVTNQNGMTPLHLAACYGNAEIARLLVQFSPQILNIRTQLGNLTALQIAASRSEEDVVEVLKSFPTLDQEGLEDAQNRAIFRAYRAFGNNLSRVTNHFHVFNPIRGAVGGLEGSLPWNVLGEDGIMKRSSHSVENGVLPGIMKMSMVALSATFEEFCNEITHESYERALKQNAFKDEWIRHMLNAHMTERKGIEFYWQDFSPSLRKAKHQQTDAEEDRRRFAKVDRNIRTVLAAREFLVGKVRGPEVAAFLEHRGLDAKMQIVVKPTLETFCESFQELFACGNLLTETIMQLDFNTFNFTILIPQNAITAQRVTFGDCSFDTLNRLSRLFYGMRCVFAHGSPEPTFRNALQVADFVPGNFGGDNSALIAEFFNEMKLRLREQHRACSVTYEYYVVCLRFYRFLGWVLHSAISACLFGVTQPVMEDLADSVMMDDKESLSSF